MSTAGSGGRAARFIDWVDERFPLTAMMKEHVTEYYAAKNFNIWYVFGVLALVVLILQLVTGIFLTMNYKPSADGRLRVRRIHHARSGVGLADPLHALHRRLDVLRGRLSAHVPRR